MKDDDDRLAATGEHVGIPPVPHLREDKSSMDEVGSPCVHEDQAVAVEEEEEDILRVPSPAPAVVPTDHDDELDRTEMQQRRQTSAEKEADEGEQGQMTQNM